MNAVAKLTIKKPRGWKWGLLGGSISRLDDSWPNQHLMVYFVAKLAKRLNCKAYESRVAGAAEPFFIIIS